jgi:hypothetical protein
MTVSNAEAIAQVVADMRAKRILPSQDAAGHLMERSSDGDRITGNEVARLAHTVIVDPVVIDACAIHDSITDAAVDIYADHPCIAPPFPEMAISFVNDYGNVLVNHVLVAPSVLDNERWETADPVDWDRVRWRLTCNLYVGGHTITENRVVRTRGPVYMWRIAIYDDGEMADLTWVDLSPSFTAAGRTFDREMLTLLGTLNFLNCSNIDVIEPARPRAERRRIQRAGEGVVVKSIHVYPPGPLRRSGAKGEPLTSDGATSPMRGHFAHYGEKYNRGLLFGKYEGKFWHPARVRVTGGRPDVDYEVHA